MQRLKRTSIFCLSSFLLLGIVNNSSFAQDGTSTESAETATESAPTGDRELVKEAIKNFYIGDHTGSTKHKKLSMHKNGAYRYVNKQGEFVESKFRLDSDNSDPSYKEELLSIEVYENVALARLRLEKLEKKPDSKVEFKLMTLHKTNQGWKITSICWGFGITH